GNRRGRYCRMLAVAAPAGYSPRHLECADPAAGDPAGDDVLPDLAVLPESWSFAGKRREPHDDASDSRRHDVIGGSIRGLDRRRRPGSPWRKTVGCAIRYPGGAGDGGADAAAGRRDRASADAGGPGRRILRGEAATHA